MICMISVIRLIYFRICFQKKVMGVGVVIAAGAIGSLITSDMVKDLKKQINKIVDKHKDITNKAKKLSDDLKKMDFGIVNKKLKLMNDDLTLNLKTILSDGKLKLEIIEKGGFTKQGVPTQSALEGLLEVLNYVSTIFTMVEIMCATNPYTIAISGFLLVLNSILSFYTMVINIKQIKKLKKKKKQLEHYYKKGGEFEQEMKKLADVCFQIVENFYIVVINFNSMMNELRASINILAISKPDHLNYAEYLHNLNRNPFNYSFEQECLKLYQNFIRIQKKPFEHKINMSCKYLDSFESKNNIIQKLKVMSEICGHFNKDSAIGKELKGAFGELKQITTLKQRFESRFLKRKKVARKDLEPFDKQLLGDMQDDSKHLKNKKEGILDIVSFYTTEFFGDDKSGKTLYKTDLKKIFEKTELLNYLGVTSRKQNVIYVPEPIDKHLHTEWQSCRNILKEDYLKKSKHKEKDVRLNQNYIRFEVDSFIADKEKKPKLKFLYGMTFRLPNSHVDDFYEQELSFLKDRSHPKNKNKMIDDHSEGKALGVHEDEDEDENLAQLCEALCCFINGVAYPERIVKLDLEDKSNYYAYHVEWKEQTVNEDIFGKKLSYQIIPAGTKIESNELKGSVFDIKEIKGEKVQFKFT